MKETLTGRQITMLIIMFIIGTLSITITGIAGGRDVWLSAIIAIIIGLATAAIYVRLMTILPGKDFFSVLEFFLGKVFGRIAIALMVYFAFSISFMMLTHFGMFVVTLNLTETPIYVIYFSILLISAIAIKNGIEVLGRWNQIALIFILFFLLISFLFSTQKLDITNLRPVMYNGIVPVIKGSLSFMSIPICETSVFMLALPVFKRGVSGYKSFLGGIVFGGAVILLIALMDILVLGVDNCEKFLYLTYKTLSLIKIGEFLTRLEIVGAFTFTLSVFLKLSIAFLGTCKGIAKIFGFDDYRFLVMPMALLIGATATYLLNSVIEFANTIPRLYVFLLPFEVGLPLILFIFIEIKYRVLKKKNRLPGGAAK